MSQNYLNSGFHTLSRARNASDFRKSHRFSPPERLCYTDFASAAYFVGVRLVTFLKTVLKWERDL